MQFKQLLASESTNGVLSPMIGHDLIPGSDQNFGPRGQWRGYTRPYNASVFK